MTKLTRSKDHSQCVDPFQVAGGQLPFASALEGQAGVRCILQVRQPRCVVDRFMCVAFLYSFCHTTPVLGGRLNTGTARRAGISPGRNVGKRSNSLHIHIILGWHVGGRGGGRTGEAQCADFERES